MASTTLKSEHVTSIPAITGQIDYSKAIHLFPEALQPWRTTILAYGSTFVSTTIGFPLDTVKTRMQTHKNFTSYFDCISKTYSKEGTRGFFRGIWAPLISTSLSRSLSVSIFTGVKPGVYNALYGRVDDSFTSKTNPLLLNAPVCLLSGLVSGGVVSLFACPFEFTKVYSQILGLLQHKSMKDLPHRLQANHQQLANPSTMATIRQIVRYEGFRGLYSGYKYHLLRDAFSSGLYYCIYESLKGVLNAANEKYKIGSPQLSIMLSGGLAGTLCWVFVFPLDTTKSRIQKDVVTNILRKEQGLEPLPPRASILQKGQGSLYRGLGISCTRAFVSNMIFFSIYEFVMAHIV